jgi:hypothetical protein
MLKLALTVIAETFLLALPGAGAQTPGTLLMNASRLATIKATWQQDNETGQLVKPLQNQAGTLMIMSPLCITGKPVAPEGGTKHDYMSQAPYFWYDSSKPNGKPYISKDGLHNPEADLLTDRQNLIDLDNACRVLSLAWYLTGEEKYAEKASSLLRYWFINGATKMNPNLNYAQAIPGLNNGRGIGVIESIPLTGIADASLLLAGAASWTDKDENLLKNWYREYLDWMLNSKNGKSEHVAQNNHGTWFLVQVVDFALFTGDTLKAAALLQESKKLFDNQVEKDGGMPLELVRTNALAYSTLNLQGWFRLSCLAEKAGTDLWNYRNKNSATLRTALNWVMPYVLGEKLWTYQQIGDYDEAAVYRLLLEAGVKYNTAEYLGMAKKVKRQANDIMADLLYGQ